MIKHQIFYFSLIGLFLLLGSFSCLEKDREKRLHFEISNLEGIDRVDTLEAYPEQGIYVLGLMRHFALGDFTYDLGLVKQVKDSQQIFYESKLYNNILRISADYIAFVDRGHGFNNIGWYYVKNRQIQDTLLGFRQIKDSIEKTVPESVWVALTKSYISVYSKPEKRFYYQEFVLENTGDSLENLEYGLYILENQILKKISDNGEDIYSKSNGTFYIPAPGLGINQKWKKSKLLEALDSVTNQLTPPKNFFIDQNP